MLEEALALEEAEALVPAAIGKGDSKSRDRSIRTDKIGWIEKFDSGATQLVYDIFEGLRLTVKRELFLPLRRFECHFSKYEPGGFYKRHRDRHKKMPSRMLSCVVYLSDMTNVAGGELVLHPKGENSVTIQPTPGRIIVFDSSIIHEVKLCSAERRSLTGWLRNDLKSGLKL